MQAVRHTAPFRPFAISGSWAIDRSFDLHGALATLADAMARDTPPAMPQASTADGFPYYINPDGTAVPSRAEGSADRVQQGAVAVVPLKGVVLAEAPDWAQQYGFTSSIRFSAAIDAAAADPKVSTILVAVDGPGGMVKGTQAAANSVVAANATKPVHTHVHGQAASASYWIASQAGTITLNDPSTEVGSIGIMATLVDDAKFWAEFGIEWLDVYATDSTDKNLEVRAMLDNPSQRNDGPMKARLDALNTLFHASIKAARPAVQADALKGAMYFGQKAVDMGLADGIGTLGTLITKATTPQQPNTNPMNILQKAAKAIQETWAKVTGEATAITAENLKAANEALKAEGITGVQLITDEDAKAAADAKAELATTKQQLEAATKATEAMKPQADAAAATATTLATTLKEGNVDVKEGATLAELTTLAVDTLKKWGANAGTTHTGAGKQGDQKTDAQKEADAILSKGMEQASVVAPATVTTTTA